MAPTRVHSRADTFARRSEPFIPATVAVFELPELVAEVEVAPVEVSDCLELAVLVAEELGPVTL